MSEDCLKVTSYFGERLRAGGRLYSDVLLDAFEAHGVAASVVLRATGGFGRHHLLRSDRTLTMSEDPTVVAVAVDTVHRMSPLLPRLVELQPGGMLTAERARLAGEGFGPAVDEPHLETKLTVHLGRGGRAGGVPAYVVLCESLRAAGVAGASVLLGVDGTVRAERRRARLLGRNLDVPALVVAVGATDRIESALPALGRLPGRPLVTLERVRVCKRDGRTLAAPYELADVGADGLARWHQLTVITSESHLHEGEPVHRALARRLRASGAAGLTSLRGVWGFHGDHAPHGDRLVQLGRRVPVVTVLVDTPSRIAASYAVVDELTERHGLVTSELVPAMAYVGKDRTRRGGLRLARPDW